MGIRRIGQLHERHKRKYTGRATKVPERCAKDTFKRHMRGTLSKYTANTQKTLTRGMMLEYNQYTKDAHMGHAGQKYTHQTLTQRYATRKHDPCGHNAHFAIHHFKKDQNSNFAITTSH